MQSHIVCQLCQLELETAAGKAVGVCGWCLLEAREAEELGRRPIPTPGYRGQVDPVDEVPLATGAVVGGPA